MVVVVHRPLVTEVLTIRIAKHPASPAHSEVVNDSLTMLGLTDLAFIKQTLDHKGHIASVRRTDVYEHMF